ncbi:MAG: S-adenosylmethionine:tRNA ribosyltransferase-isomerase [Chlorobiota bacterium]|jgi:S-adenosylmethionine:tRNA ribosyltransferase-isomerase|nr:S-adenosylmethionine:tRNA ribosyltransferase-isomerase [Chlorobiota bacterium]QQS66485.1 MAG: S-adenosylmethionine:tRNA ribosyltransferase-isomerase [Chlorobiota bacterium]
MQENNISEITGETSLMILPQYKIKSCKRLVTNFHQPQSTLLLLVESILGGVGYWKEVYKSALENNYRFLSYGDSSLIICE